MRNKHFRDEFPAAFPRLKHFNNASFIVNPLECPDAAAPLHSLITMQNARNININISTFLLQKTFSVTQLTPSAVLKPLCLHVCLHQFVGQMKFP